MLELARQLADNDDPLEILLAGNQAVFRFGSIELVTKLIDGKFPDYERVIPTAHPKLINFARQPLLSALQRAAILTNDKFRGVRMVLEDGLLRIVSTNAEQEEAMDELEIDYQGDKLDIGFNVTYLLDVLNNLSLRDGRLALQRRQLQRPDHPPGQREVQVRRDADAHLTPWGGRREPPCRSGGSREPSCASARPPGGDGTRLAASAAPTGTRNARTTAAPVLYESPR